MTDSNIAPNHLELLNELSMIRDSEKLKNGNLLALKSVYLKINLSYITLCEQNSNLPYMPSSRSDMLFSRYKQLGDIEKAREIVQNRLADIAKYVARI
jgi:hypothetical protein